MRLPSNGTRWLAFALIAAATILGLAGTDLVLPAVPTLPLALTGDIASAQFVIAAFVAGTAIGLVAFGAVGPRFGRRQTLVGALAAYALLSYAATLARHFDVLIVLRFLQGIVASAPAVFAPAFIRTFFDDIAATKALGLLGSLESLVPAFAPLLGAWLLRFGGWHAPFLVTAGLTAILVVAFFPAARALPDGSSLARGSYLTLMRNPSFWRYAASHSLVLGGLLIFVFSAPAVIVTTMGGSISNFVTMQIVGVTCFILAANVTGVLVQRHGSEPLIVSGTFLAGGSALTILGYALGGGNDPSALVLLFAPMNVGLGLRGPPGFFLAIAAGEGDDERAASLTLLAVVAVAAGGTALLAPFIHLGLIAVALVVALAQVLAGASLLWLPRLTSNTRGVP
jgi:MFS transporter, DHA1 family, multidrug resistance protein